MIQLITVIVDGDNPRETYLRAKGSFPDSSLLDLKAAKDKYEEIVLLLNVLKNTTGWTDQIIADKLGYARSTIQKWKGGYLRPGSFHQDEIIEQLKELIRRN